MDDNVTRMEVDSFKRLLELYAGFEKSFNEYNMKLQCLIAECIIGDEDAIFSAIRGRLLERMESQAAVVTGILDEIKHERKELQEIVNNVAV